jgi:hypothetical protein
MHNSVIFYRKSHNFSFYPIIHKKVLIFAKRSPPQGGRPFCIVRVSLLYDAFPTAGKDALHRNVPVKYDEIRVVILSTRCRSGALSAIFRITRKALRQRRREQHIQLGMCFQQRPHGVRNRFRAHFPEYAEGKTFCYSWLLSPALEKLLPETSKILGFQRRFDVLYVNEDEDGYKQWVFKTIDLPPERFPENTTLQRNMKAYVLAGGKIGEAFGILR